MYSTESSSSVVAEDEGEEDGLLYQFIYDLNTTNDKEEKEKLQIPPRDGSEDKTTHNTKQAQRQEEQKVDNAAGPDMDTSNNIQVIPVVKANEEEKPWRKVGANISDYFNYGFDEDSWKKYCKKQSKIRADSKKLCSKIKVQKRHNRHEMKESCSTCPSSGRQSSATTDVIRGQPGPSGRVEGRHCLRDKGNTTQVVSDMSPEEDRITFYNLPPPPTFLFQRGPPPLSPNATLESGQGFDDPTASLYPCSSGLSSLILRRMFSRAGLIEYTKALAGMDRDRSRELGHDKDSKGGRERDRESCSSSYNSGEERMSHREPEERGKRKRRHSDQSKGWQKSPCSSSSRSRRDVGEDRDSQSRPKHKKAKRNRKDKGTNKMSSADQERKLKSD